MRLTRPQIQLLISEHKYIIGVLLFGFVLTWYLFDTIFPFDASSWFENAVNLYENGETGAQFRNILYSYFLLFSLFFKIDPTCFGLFLSQFSLLICAFFLYLINSSYSNKKVASVISLIFILSLPLLRYSTQILSDIPAVLFITITIYFTVNVLDGKKLSHIPLVYLFASMSISLRYASIFYFPAFVYFIWITKKSFRHHLLGIVLAIFPFIPQVIYNVHYLNHSYSISYSAHQPTLGIQYFFQELQWGYRLQIFQYLKLMLFHFRGIIILFLPMVAVGFYYFQKDGNRRVATYLNIFFISFLSLLSFFVAFANRYAIPALIPCFIWFNVGMDRLYARAEKDPIKKVLYYLWICFALYINFEISFNLVQSSRAVHKARYEIVTTLNTLLVAGDLLITELDLALYDSRVKSISIKNKMVIVEKRFETALIDSVLSEGNAVYIVHPESRWYAEGKNVIGNLLQDTHYRYNKVSTVKSAVIAELLLYKVVRRLNKSNNIPEEKWVLYRLSCI